jgi:UTP--glucose-1-phosphate uridylyltransferase
VTISKAVFPAAGLGTRFLPVTKALPKELLPLVDTPLIQYGIEEAAQAGLNDIYIITGRGKGAIEDYFDTNMELESILSTRHALQLLETIKRISESINVAYLRQREAKGLGHAIWCARRQLVGEAFGVILADDVIASEVPCIAQLLRVYEKVQAPVVALMRVAREESSSYGIIEGEPAEVPDIPQPVHRLKTLIEKPRPENAPSDLAVIGRYVLTPDVLCVLDAGQPGLGGEIQLTDALNVLAARQPVYGVCFSGKRYDAGSKLGFLKAAIEFGLRREDVGDGLRSYLLELVQQLGAPARPAEDHKQAAGSTT